MKYRLISAVLAATVLLLGASLSVADELKAIGAGGGEVAPGKPVKMKPPKESKKELEAKRKTLAMMNNPVDINSASAAELKKLPGIGDAEALRIIEGRPYGSKAWLTTNNVISMGIYLDIEDFIVARLPFKDGKKNIEYLKKAAEKKKAAGK